MIGMHTGLVSSDAQLEAQRRRAEAAVVEKCRPCGCLHGTLAALGAATQGVPAEAQPLLDALARAHYALLTGSPFIHDAAPGEEPPPPSPPAAEPAASGHT